MVVYLTAGVNVSPGEPPDAGVTPTQAVAEVAETVAVGDTAAAGETVAVARLPSWNQLSHRPVPLPRSKRPKLPLQPQSPSPAWNPPRYLDDFSDPASGWKMVVEDTYTMDYLPDGTYRITLTVADKMAVAFPPYPFSKPAGLIIGVRAGSAGANGAFGVMCQLQDQSNYYRVSFRGSQYGVDKVIQGQLVELTEPYWKDLIAYEPAPDGMLTITLACLDGRIQLLVNDVGQEIISDSDLTSGDAAIFVAAGSQPDANGVYMEAIFDDFSAEVP